MVYSGRRTGLDYTGDNLYDAPLAEQEFQTLEQLDPNSFKEQRMQRESRRFGSIQSKSEQPSQSQSTEEQKTNTSQDFGGGQSNQM